MLVGRESERRAIGGLLAGARVGESRAMVLSGEPGIGKSALLADAASVVGDMRVLRAQGIESEQLVPFAGLLQLLRPLLDLLDAISPPQAAALSSALLLGAEPAAPPSRFAVGAATLSLLARAAEDRPVAVLVDDGHLLDEPSAQALVFAARRLDSDAVAVLVGVRDGEPGAATWAPLPRVELRGLDLAAAGELVARASGPVDRERLLRLHRETAGNPLGLVELADRVAPDESVPSASPLGISERLTRSFLGRADELPQPAGLALLVAATDGASAATVRAACARLGLDDRSLADAEDAGLVAVRGDEVRFRHPLVRSAVYGAADPGARRAVHRALAAVVPPHESDRLAWHLSQGAVAPDEPTARLLDEVAGQATRRGAHAIAAGAHERAADLGAAPGASAARLAAAGEAAWLAGRTDRAVALLARAHDSAPSTVLAAHIQELRGAVETRCGSLEAALETLTAAAAAVESVDPDTAVRLLADSVHVSFYLGDPAAGSRARVALERLLPRSAVGPDARCLGTVARGMAMVISGSGAAGVELIRGATYPLVEDSDSGPTDRFRLPLRVQGALWLRDSWPHRDLVVATIDRMREEASLGSLPYLLMHIARDAATSDHWDDAESAYTESIRLARETGQSTDLGVGLAGLAQLQARRGLGVECLALATEARELCSRNHIRLGALWADYALGDLAFGSGDVAAAVSHYETLEAVLASSGLADPDQSCGPELVETYVHLGRRDDAHRVAERFSESARAKGQPWAQARAARATALCTADPSAEQCFREALALHQLTPDRFETARTELAYGSWLRRDRRRTEARPLLRSALDRFERLGAAPWTDKAAQELRATGETVRRRESDARDELTPQERQIAQLLARGRTTREAAAALFLSPKTVEYHLRHVYLKLGIRSRAALTELFGD